jgi:predicted dehydrogenase
MTTKTDPVKFKEVEESMTYELKFANGISASCTTTYKVNGFNRTTAYADRGTFGLTPAFNYDGIKGWRSDQQAAGWRRARSVRDGDGRLRRLHHPQPPDERPGEMGLRDVRTMMALYESARTGRMVRLG